MKQIKDRLFVAALRHQRTEHLGMSLIELASGVSNTELGREVRNQIFRIIDRDKRKGNFKKVIGSYCCLLKTTQVPRDRLLDAIEVAFLNHSQDLASVAGQHVVNIIIDQSTAARPPDFPRRDKLPLNIKQILLNSDVRDETQVSFVSGLYSGLKDRVSAFEHASQTGAEFLTDSISQFVAELINTGWGEYLIGFEQHLPEDMQISPQILTTLGKQEKWLGNYERACDLFREALLNPSCRPEAHFELAESLEHLEQDEEAIAEAEKGLACVPEDVLFRFARNRLTILAGPKLRLGDFEGGWAAHMRRRDRLLLDYDPPRPIWNGPDSDCKKLIVISEGGVGDELKYASCYRELLTHVPNIVASADPRLVPLLQRSIPEIQFVEIDRQDIARGWGKRASEKGRMVRTRAFNLELASFVTAFDQFVLSGDLPTHLRKSREAFPIRDKGYLTTSEAHEREWKSRLSELGPGLKVGISWRSRHRRTKTMSRNQHYFGLSELLPLLSTKGIHFVNLQYDDPEREIERFELENGIAIHRWDDVDLHNDFEAVAALMKSVDLVISPHNMIKELAGAVGAPTIFLNPSTQAWIRWRAYSDDLRDVWHYSVKHIRGHRPGDKDNVIQAAKTHLERLVDDRNALSDFEAASCGQHAKPAHGSVFQVDDIDEPEAKDISAEPFTNEYGETFEPAGAKDVKNPKVRTEEWKRRQVTFEQVVTRLFKGVVQPASPDGVFLILGQSHKQYSLNVLAAHALIKHNWASVCLDRQKFALGQINNDNVAFFEARLIRDAASKSRIFRVAGQPGLRFNWELDLKNRVCRAEGMNFYGTLANLIGKEFRKYPSDLTDPPVASRVRELLHTCDAALSICFEAEERLARKGMQVRITGWEQDYPPTGIFKIYCAERGYKHGIEFVEILQGYQKYFRGGRSGMVSAVDCQNVTRHHLCSASTLRGDLFDAWYKAKANDLELAEKGREWAGQNRSEQREIPIEGKVVLDRINEHRRKGGKIACLYGSVPYDFGHPWLDAGPAHRDRRDWYNHTVATLGDTDTLLLIKPHPDEARSDQIGIPNQYFVEMLEQTVPDNVIILGHRWLNNGDILPLLDFGIVWRGSVAPELALMDVPVITCNPRSMAEQVLDLTVPKSRNDYEKLLHNPKKITLNKELKKRASVFFEFYRTQVMIPYPFGWISQKRKFAGPPVWSDAALSNYRHNGHPSIEEMCKRIISA